MKAIRQFFPDRFAPAMVGPSLNDNIACTKRHLADIDKKCDFAFKNDAVVDRLSAVHVRVARLTCICRGGLRTNLGKMSARLRRIKI